MSYAFLRAAVSYTFKLLSSSKKFRRPSVTMPRSSRLALMESILFFANQFVQNIYRA